MLAIVFPFLFICGRPFASCVIGLWASCFHYHYRYHHYYYLYNVETIIPKINEIKSLHYVSVKFVDILKDFILGSSIENFITLSRSGIGTNCEVKRNRNSVNKEEIFITIFYLISKSTMLNKY